MMRLPEFTHESVSAKKLTMPPSETGTLKKLTWYAAASV